MHPRSKSAPAPSFSQVLSGLEGKFPVSSSKHELAGSASDRMRPPLKSIRLRLNVTPKPAAGAKTCALGVGGLALGGSGSGARTVETKKSPTLRISKGAATPSLHSSPCRSSKSSPGESYTIGLRASRLPAALREDQELADGDDLASCCSRETAPFLARRRTMGVSGGSASRPSSSRRAGSGSLAGSRDYPGPGPGRYSSRSQPSTERTSGTGPAQAVEGSVVWESFCPKTGILKKRIKLDNVRVLHRLGLKALVVATNVEGSRSIDLSLSGKLTVHANHLQSGKLGVRNHNSNAHLLISNADPDQLQRLVELMAATKGRKKAPSSGKKATSPGSKHRLEMQRRARRVSDSVTNEQRHVLDLVRQGKNVFFTGSAGTGKSWLLKELMKLLPPDTTALTASTGIAASTIGGTTVHAFAGISSSAADRGDWHAEAARLVRSADTMHRWRKVCTLVVDEVSMIDDSLFEGLEYLARALRGNTKPFGGIQLVLCGDFFQLPPVSKRMEPKGFCFEASCWQRCVHSSVELTQVFRQSDPTFVSVLNDLRVGKASMESLAALNARWAVAPDTEDGILYTKLFTHRREVDEVNTQELQALGGQATVFTAEDRVRVRANIPIDSLCPAKKTLRLKLHTQVILVKTISISDGLTNGARGVVVGFSGTSFKHPIVKFSTRQKEVVVTPEEFQVMGASGVIATRKQIPLDLAWALSVHKSQGMTLEKVEVCLARCFEYGQAYVALSRARSLEGLILRSKLEAASVKAHPKALAFYNACERLEAETGAGREER